MFGRIIGLISYLLCAILFFIIAKYNKDSYTPISFWSGDTSLQEKVKNVKEYNLEMSKLYSKCSLAFVITGILCIIQPIIGIIFSALECTVGIYVVWRCYKKILSKYS